ncbi:MAG TPA: hypothetical protein DCZ94_19275 [Lentisphaeria bacterium]|nr:hypothetical protein [Lentisphaeria bacterium]
MMSSNHSVLGTSTYTYDGHGRLFSQLANVRGANTYPAKYCSKAKIPSNDWDSYDPVGRMKTLSDGNGSATTWNYDPQRGFMTSKAYADGSSISYTYNADGSVSTRNWARGIVTTYAYNAAGELTGVTYGGAAASPVTFTRDLFGRPTTITDGTGSRTLSYNNDFTISSETIPNIAGHSVSYGYDNLGRRNAMSLQNGGTALNTANYTYDGMSRLASVGNGTNTASYTRISGSSLLSTTTIGNLTTTRAYDNLNRLTSISSVSPASTMSYSYVYNNSDQRSRVNLSDGSYWVYKYDQYGQVVGAHKYSAAGVAVPGQQFDYAFDTIGNRKVEKRNGNVFEYKANELNQYSQRTVPGSVNITGSADETAEVRIQKASDNMIFKPDRLGKYYSKGFALDNSAAPVDETFNIFAVKYDPAQQKDIVAKLVERMFLAKTPEVFSHDPDGNLTSDGRFTYTWDGENRLVSIESRTGVSPVSKVKLDFSYDYMGRRVSKTVYSWVNNAWQVSKAEKYAYDGWNCIAKFNASNALQESYLWGEDLSGSLQGAGGVGGLLAVSIPSTSSTYVPVYDGNGNVMAYVDASNGNKVAEYEYDAFGRTIVKAGVKADDMAYKFSTKYLDSETGDYYYGYRYYNADTGRWLGRDPIQEQGFRLNQYIRTQDNTCDSYIFIKNNSISSYDILGLLTFSATLVYPKTGLANETKLAPAAAYAKDLFKKFGIDFQFTYKMVQDSYTEYTPAWGWVPWWTYYEMKEISAPSYENGEKTIGYLSSKLAISNPVLFTDFFGYRAYTFYTKGVIILYGLGTPSNEKTGQIIVHELLAHYYSGYKHSLADDPAWKGWEQFITQSEMEKWEEKISCQVAEWIRKNGGNPDPKYIGK